MLGFAGLNGVPTYAEVNDKPLACKQPTKMAKISSYACITDLIYIFFSGKAIGIKADSLFQI